MENLETNAQTNNPLTIDNEMKGYLIESAKWAKFLSILGFIGLGLVLLASFFLIMLGATYSRYPYGGGIPSWAAIFYILIVILYYFPINYLFQFSNRMKQGINNNDQSLLSSAFQNLKSHYKFIGIFSIVIISLYILVILLGVLMVAIR